MAIHNETGKWGEELAALYLTRLGYNIMERNWRSGHREIDLIALDPDKYTVVFVEVKTRSSDALAQPEDAIDHDKIKNLGIAASHYATINDLTNRLRFDIVSVIGHNAQDAVIRHTADAFNPGLG